MATVSFANLAADFDVSIPLPSPTGGGSGATRFEWDFTGLKLIFLGTFDLDYHGSITTFQLDLGTNASIDMEITGLAADLSDIFYPPVAPANMDEQTSLVWRTVLGGADTIDLGSNTTTNGYTITLAGDGGNVEAGWALNGQNDNITGDSGGSTVSGDYSTVKEGGFAFGGNDTIEVGGFIVNGDAWYVEAGGYLIGGDDALATSPQAAVQYLIGDVDYVYGTVVGGNDTLEAGHADQAFGDAYYVTGRLYGGDDLIFGGSTAATLVGDADVLGAGGWLRAGNDRIYGGSGGDLIVGDVRYNDGGTLIGGDDLLFGNGGNDTIHGNGGNDSLHGGAGLDEMYGGDGHDHFYLDSVSDLVDGEIIDGGDGYNTLHFGNDGLSYDYDLTVGTFTILSINELVFDTVNFGTATAQLQASAFGSGLIASGGTITGNSAARVADTLRFVMGDTLDFTGPPAILRLRNFDDPLDKIVIDGDGDGERIAGTEVNDSISGNGGNDTLFSSEGRDTMRGGSGSDAMLVIAPHISGGEIYDGGDGTDTLAVNAIVDDARVDLRAVKLLGFENLELSAFSGDTVTAQILASQLGTGLSRSATITAPTVGTTAILEITAGSSTLIDLTDLKFPDFGSGDRVVVKGGTVAATIFGSRVNDSITGSTGSDYLRGGGGNDTLNGGANVDTADFADKTSKVSVTLVNGNGAAKIGSSETDTLIGIENIAGGRAGDALTGDSIANRLSGNDGNDTLRGGLGNDTLDGGTGIDTADFSDKSAKVTVDLTLGRVTVAGAAAESDTLIGIENLTGGSAGDALTGDKAGNVLVGNGGKDTLKGGLGADTLTGSAGNDKFVFNSKLGAGNIDVITDFKHNGDLLQLDDAIFKKIGSSLSSGEFYAKNGATQAHDKDDRIVYDKKTGNLYYDSDGKGGHAAIHFATLTNKPTLDHGDFDIV